MAKVRIQEVRKLLLPLETVVDAILELDRSHGGTLGNARLTEVRIVAGADPGVTLVISQGAAAAAPSVEKHFTLPAIAAAAIHYCFRARIPLPRQAMKSIEVMPDGFQLTIQTTTEVLRLHGKIPAVSHVARAATAQSGGTPHEAVGDAALDDPTNTRTGASGTVATAATPETGGTPASAAA